MNNDLVNISSQLNELLQKYLDITLVISELLDNEENDALGVGINRLFGEREQIITTFDELKIKYRQAAGQDVGGSIKDTEDKRKQLLILIQETDSKNAEKINRQYSDLKEKIKHLSDGKKAYNAYNTIPTVSDGVFIDKRK